MPHFYSCGGFNTPTLCVVTKGIKAECNHLMRTTYPDACVGVVDSRSGKLLHTRCGLRYLFLLNLSLFFKGGHRLGVRSPQVSSLEIPLSLGTTKGLSPFGIPNYLFIVIF